MSRIGGWLRSGAKPDNASKSEVSVDSMSKEVEDIENAMQWAGLIMNDDLEGAWKALQEGDSAFHRLGSAVTIFLRSILGWEKAVMAETTDRLADTEAKAWADYKKAQKKGLEGCATKLYPPGTEYELVRAETQLMSAVVGVLNESLIEAMKSFYKLRKAYVTLDSIIAHEEKAMAKAAESRPTTAASMAPSQDARMPGAFDDDTSDEDDEDDDLGGDGSSSGSEYGETARRRPSTAATSPDRGLDEPVSKLDSTLLDNPVDVFVHSGANMCFGILLLILTLVPPAFGRILSVVGFRGDRPRAVRMLWESTSFPNVHGAIAGMVLLAYYNGLLGAVDIVPDDRDYDESAEIVGPPRDKCDQLLARMRANYPDSRLWRVEESRQLSRDHDLAGAIEVLTTGTASKMKQITAINNFELSINAMFIQDWDLMRDSFIRALELNEWSPSMYYYMAGCASLELYRDAVEKGDADEARRQKSKADEYLRKSPTVAGRKRLMARQLPFETFLLRKIHKWEARAKALGIDLVDAVGTSPALEMCFLWNGHKRMAPADLERGLRNLSWDRCTTTAEAVAEMKKETDEMAVWAVSCAVLLRRLGRWDEARAMLTRNVMEYDRSTFKGPTKDDYVLAAATYEMGVIAWEECCNPPADEKDVLAYRRAKAMECQEFLDKVRVWEGYVLDARIGLRVQSGLETLKWFRGKMGW